MIRFVDHSDIDPDQWNETIRNASYPTVFCNFEMLDLLTGEDSWSALILDDYDYVMPLPFRSKLGVQYIFTPFFISQLGIFSQKSISPQIVSDFFNALPKSFKHIDLILNNLTDTSLIHSYTTPLISYQLDLNTSYTNIYNHYSQNIRRNIKNSYKHLLYISKNEVNVNDVICLFYENRGKKRDVHYKDRDYSTLVSATEYLYKQKKLDVWGVHIPEGTLIAAALFVHDFGRYRFWFSGRNNLYAEAKPMFFLLDEFFRSHSEQPKLFDFNGSMNENVARMYKGFGGIPYNINMINYTRQIHWQLLLKLYRLIKR